MSLCRAPSVDAPLGRAVDGLGFFGRYFKVDGSDVVHRISFTGTSHSGDAEEHVVYGSTFYEEGGVFKMYE